MEYKNLSNEWLIYIKPLIKQSTYANYEFMVIRHINPYFAKVKLKEINKDMIQLFVNEKFVSGRLDNTGGLSYKSIEDILMILNSTLDYGFVNGYLKTFAKRVKIPKTDVIKKSNTFKSSEILLLIDHLMNNINNKNIAILIAIYTGIRAGELSALKWSDIDLDNKSITISRTIQRIYLIDTKTEVIETSPKSQRANRTIPINDKLLNILTNYYGGNNNYILTNNTKPLEPRSLRYYYKYLLNSLNINYLPFHSIRHTFATRLIYNTSDYKTVSELLGHSSVSITLDIYAHSDLSQKSKCINMY